MGQTKEQRIIKQIVGTPTIQKFTPIATDMFLPNHSGIASHPETINNFLKLDGSNANQDIDIGDYDLDAGSLTVSNSSTHSFLTLNGYTDTAYTGIHFNDRGVNQFDLYTDNDSDYLKIDFNSTNIFLLTSSGSVTFNDLTLTCPALDDIHITQDNAGFLSFASQTAARPMRTRFFAYDGDGTDNNVIDIFARGTPTSQTNYSYLQIGYVYLGYYAVRSVAGGTGTHYPICLDALGSNTQLVLSTDSSSKFTGDYVEIESDSASGGALLVLDQNDTDARFFDFQGQTGASAAYSIPNWASISAPTGYCWINVMINGSTGFYIPVYVEGGC